MCDAEQPESSQSGVKYLTIEDTLGLFADLFGCSVDEAADQVRNREGLESALARPRSYAVYEDADLASQAAALTHGVAEGQHFIEGNKRMAFVLMLSFLNLNGRDVTATAHERFTWILDLSGGLTVQELAQKIRVTLVVRPLP